MNGKNDITKPLRSTKRVVNSTDATRGEPLAMRAQKRRAELELVLAKLPVEQKRTRNDIGIAISSIDTLLTGDIDNLSDSTAAELSRVLETSKHLGEVNPLARSRDRK
jgi:hypothetical protein